MELRVLAFLGGWRAKHDVLGLGPGSNAALAGVVGGPLLMSRKVPLRRLPCGTRHFHAQAGPLATRLQVKVAVRSLIMASPPNSRIPTGRTHPKRSSAPVSHPSQPLVVRPHSFTTPATHHELRAFSLYHSSNAPRLQLPQRRPRLCLDPLASIATSSVNT